MFKKMTVDEFYPYWLTVRENGRPGCMIDVRAPEEYAQAHVPGTELIPLHTLPARLNEIPKDKPVYLICQAGGRSAQAAMFLAKSLGHEQLINIEGGTMAWIAAGYPVDNRRKS